MFGLFRSSRRTRKAWYRRVLRIRKRCACCGTRTSCIELTHVGFICGICADAALKAMALLEPERLELGLKVARDVYSDLASLKL